MKNISPLRGKPIEIPSHANYVEQGEGRPVVLVHGLAASLHDWDDLLPELAASGYHGYALDLFGHGESPKPDVRSYKAKWLLKHLEAWIDTLSIAQPFDLIGHSLGGYLALRYALRQPKRVRSLVLVDPLFRIGQLPPILRRTYRHPTINAIVVERAPEWVFHWIIGMTNAALGRDGGSNLSLPEHIRYQTAVDFKRTAPGAFNIPNTAHDLTPELHRISQPTLVLWGIQDQTLDPASFAELVRGLPNATGHALAGGHVPHQSNVAEFNRIVMEFLKDEGGRMKDEG